MASHAIKDYFWVRLGELVFTPLHYVAARALWVLSKKKLDLPSLVTASMVPDIEIPVLFLIGRPYPYTRLLAHSLFGVLTIDTILTLLLLPLYLKIAYMLSHTENHNHILNLKIAVASAMLGSLSHVLIDSMHHIYTPLLYPLSQSSFDYFLLFRDWIQASLLLQTLFAMLLALTVLWEARKIGWSLNPLIFNLLIGDLPQG